VVCGLKNGHRTEQLGFSHFHWNFGIYYYLLEFTFLKMKKKEFKNNIFIIDIEE
jgi:hypothetical protein